METQSGLGAIYLLLIQGKKIFLSGKNYKHFQNLNTVIYNSREVGKLSFAEFCQPLSTEEKNHNNRIIKNLLDSEKLTDKWDNFYLNIN